jgi:hypothetical protein
MKREKAHSLIREYLTLRKKKEELQEQLGGLGDRYENFEGLRKKLENILQEELGEVRSRLENAGNLLFVCRSKGFIGWVLYCVLDLRSEYERSNHYHDLLSNLIGILIHFERYGMNRRKHIAVWLLHGYVERAVSYWTRQFKRKKVLV